MCFCVDGRSGLMVDFAVLCGWVGLWLWFCFGCAFDVVLMVGFRVAPCGSI